MFRYPGSELSSEVFACGVNLREGIEVSIEGPTCSGKDSSTPQRQWTATINRVQISSGFFFKGQCRALMATHANNVMVEARQRGATKKEPGSHASFGVLLSRGPPRVGVGRRWGHA